MGWRAWSDHETPQGLVLVGDGMRQAQAFQGRGF